MWIKLSFTIHELQKYIGINFQWVRENVVFRFCLHLELVHGLPMSFSHWYNIPTLALFQKELWLMGIILNPCTSSIYTSCNTIGLRVFLSRIKLFRPNIYTYIETLHLLPILSILFCWWKNIKYVFKSWTPRISFCQLIGICMDISSEMDLQN